MNLCKCTLDFSRLVIAAVIATFVVLLFLYLLPIKNIHDIFPEYLYVSKENLSLADKHIIDRLYNVGSLMDPQELYEKIIEYYHFLVFLLFAILALVGGFVYLQIKHSIEEQEEETIKKIDGRIESANINKKIDEKIQGANIGKRIDDVIDEEALGDKIIESIVNNQEYMDLLKEEVNAQVTENINLIYQDLNRLNIGLGNLADVRSQVEGVMRGIEADLDRLKVMYNTLRTEIDQNKGTVGGKDSSSADLDKKESD